MCSLKLCELGLSKIIKIPSNFFQLLVPKEWLESEFPMMKFVIQTFRS